MLWNFPLVGAARVLNFETFCFWDFQSRGTWPTFAAKRIPTQICAVATSLLLHVSLPSVILHVMIQHNVPQQTWIPEL